MTEARCCRRSSASCCGLAAAAAASCFFSHFPSLDSLCGKIDTPHRGADWSLHRGYVSRFNSAITPETRHLQPPVPAWHAFRTMRVSRELPPRECGFRVPAWDSRAATASESVSSGKCRISVSREELRGSSSGRDGGHHYPAVLRIPPRSGANLGDRKVVSTRCSAAEKWFAAQAKMAILIQCRRHLNNEWKRWRGSSPN